MGQHVEHVEAHHLVANFYASGPKLIAVAT
jgi:hypothetical protein